MSIRRAPRARADFTVVENRILNDRRIGWAARGLLIYLLSKPDDWKVSVPALIAETAEAPSKSGRDGVYSLLHELRDAGYATLEKTREAGKITACHWVISETPLPAETTHDPAQPTPPQPLPAKPDALLRTESTPRTESNQKNPSGSAELPLGLPLATGSGTKAPPRKIDLAPLVETWNAICGQSVSKVRKLTPEREKWLRKAMAEDFDHDPERWAEFCRRVAASAFLTGRTGLTFRPDFSWIIEPNNLVRVLEGKYDNERDRPAPPPPGTWREAPGTV
jgi:hypothetical protein